MLGNNLNEFMDDMYHNPEKEILYHGRKYIITGYIDKRCETYTLEIYTVEIDSKELFKHTSKNRNECVDAFEKAKIFEGKTIYEAENDIEVLFG